MDFLGPIENQKYLFVIHDDYSRYPIVEVLNNLQADTVIDSFDKIISMFGVPSEVRTDNGPPFTSSKF